MAEQNWVELKHPQVEGTYRAPASAVKHYKKRGWDLASKPAQTRAGATASEKKEGGA